MSRFKTSLGDEPLDLDSDIPTPIREKKTNKKAVYKRPTTVGRYKIIEELGRGAMAYVYKAYDPEIDRFLAVKVLREELANDADYRAGFIHEAKLAGQLAHPGIVTVYDVGVANDMPYIAMELLDGIPLDELLKLRGRMPLQFTVSLMVQLTRALHYAHKLGVTHRDIKPGNIICLADRKTVKITDFGIAQLDENLSSSGKAQEKVLGTPEYMSPEQILGRPLDARSDLYSLGTLLYTVITGKPPFVADDYGELFRLIVKEKPQDVDVENVSIPDELRDIIRKLLDKQPAKRYQSAEDLMPDIRELIEILDSRNHKDQATKKGFISVRVRWTLMMASLVAVTMAIGAVVVYYQQLTSMRNIAADYGYTTSRLIAFEIAEPVLLEDEVALQAIVTDLMQNNDIENIVIRDTDNNVLVSSGQEESGSNFAISQPGKLIDQSGQAKIYLRQTDGQKTLLDVDSEIYFQENFLGRVLVSISADNLEQSTRITLGVMAGLILITLLAVFVLTLIFARQITKESERLGLGLERIRRGQFNRRMTVERKDEFGHLSVAFNLMAESLEKRFDERRKLQTPDLSTIEVSKHDGTTASSKDDEASTLILKRD